MQPGHRLVGLEAVAGEDEGGFEEVETLRADEALARREERAGKSSEHRAHRERRQFRVRGVNPQRATRDLVLAHRLPGAADRQPPHPQRHPVGDQREREDEIEQKDDAVDRVVFDPEEGGEAVVVVGERQPSEERRPRDRRDAVRSACKALPVEQHQPDDLAECERDDGEIVAAQPQDRKAEEDAERRGQVRARVVLHLAQKPGDEPLHALAVDLRRRPFPERRKRPAVHLRLDLLLQLLALPL